MAGKFPNHHKMCIKEEKYEHVYYYRGYKNVCERYAILKSSCENLLSKYSTIFCRRGYMYIVRVGRTVLRSALCAL